MIEKVIKYEDFNGVEREEKFYFHISKAEMSRKEFTTQGGYAGYLERIVKEKDSTELYKIFEEIIGLAYGEKSDDGRRLIKERNGESLFKQFQETPAYDELIMELFDAEKAAEFMKGIFPKDVTSKIDEGEIKRQIAG